MTQSKWPKWKERLGRWVWLAIPAAVLATALPLLLLATYNHPSSDDYTFALGVHDVILQYGFDLPKILAEAWRGSMEYWRQWQGTYSSCFLFSLQPGIWGDKYYALTTPLMLGSLALGFGWLGRAVWRWQGLRGPHWVWLSAGAWLMAVQGLPYAVDALYWYNGSVHYTFFAGLTLWSFGLLLQCWYAPPRRRPLFYAAAALLALIVCGGNTVTAWLELLVFCLAALLFLWRRRWGIVLPALAAVAGFALNLLAPGTLYRASGMDKRYGLVGSVFVSIRTTAQCMADWVTPALVFGLLLITPVLLMLVRQSRWSFRLPGVALAFLYLLYSAMLCVPVYSMGDAGPARLLCAEFELLVLFLTAGWGYLLGWLDRRLPALARAQEKLNAHPLVTTAVCLLCVAGVLAFGSTEGKSVTMEAVAELQSGEAQLYDLGMTLRIQDYLNPEITDVECPALRNQPELLFHNDISGDPNEYHSQAVANYYHKNSVRRVYYGEY